ncbi:2-dehydro-3-deoxy-phosphogluconate aldolase [Sporosalibacterium faouarense]|uniref:2-dehydro-3-deoxy-phosphogluconate aldolase n=1 Tax=Sporosalibacterium faouarense TaxID=516123 RepID=UPI00192AF633|nr:KDGP aldolase [Sporosalibacterium faouarense]
MELNNYSFYKDRVAINLLAKNLENAKEVTKVLDNNAVIGILSKDFATVDEGIGYVNTWKNDISVISIGLGGGDPNQWKMAADIAAATDPGHVNQVFTSAGFTAGLLEGNGCTNTVVNALVSPTGEIGKVKISTGPISSLGEDAIVDVDIALKMLKDVGVNSIKFFHMKGNKYLDELAEVVRACVRVEIPIIEPTGGITVDNIFDIVKVCVDAGCEKVIPHVYSAAIDKETGLTDPDIVKDLYNEIKKVFE